MIEPGIYAAVAEPSAATVAQFSGIPVHPGEDTSAKEEDDWWRVTENVIANSDAIHFISNRTPPRLSGLDQVNLSGYTAVAVPAAATSLNQHLAALEHNRKVEAALAENARRVVVLKDYIAIFSIPDV